MKTESLSKRIVKAIKQPSKTKVFLLSVATVLFLGIAVSMLIEIAAPIVAIPPLAAFAGAICSFVLASITTYHAGFAISDYIANR